MNVIRKLSHKLRWFTNIHSRHGIVNIMRKLNHKLVTVGVGGTLHWIYCKLEAVNDSVGTIQITTDEGRNDDPESMKQALREKRKIALQDYFREDSKLHFLPAKKPKVTILLILWNQAELTLACLEALQEQDDGSWEVLIIDNAFTDKTHDLLKTLSGVKVIYNDKNIGFLQAVNQGALQAKGHYLLLLNNDAVVQKGSIRRAINTIESSNDIGAVGGRVILPHGLLQEAGSIIWQEGTCLGYARNRIPQDNCVMFMRDVDYCSGVFLLTKTKLFCDMGGFDLRYVPAYYEESDYCVRLWKNGLRVVYDPFVVLDHYEFGSSATSSQAMQLMHNNQLKFLKAHQEFLAHQYSMSEKNILQARMRNRYKGKILIIDDRVPMRKLGAGYPRANTILNILVKERWFVTLYPLQHITDDWQDVYESIPNEIEVMLNMGASNLENFMEERKDYYDVIFISRPINMGAVKDLYHSRPDLFATAKIVYDAEALWSVREIMEKELCGRTVKEQTKKKLIDEEVGLATFSNTVLTVNQQEADYFIQSGFKDVYILGHALETHKTPNEFAMRKNILFVGAMSDDGSPNVDSVVWFINEVFPLVQKALPEPAKLYLVGRTGARELKKVASDQIVVVGMVEDLTEWYNQCRIFIAPTRFAAGKKKKKFRVGIKSIISTITHILISGFG